MCRPLIVVLGSLGVIAASGWLDGAPLKTATQESATEAPGGDAKRRFAGTWRLVSIERLGPKGELLPSLTPPAIGSPNAVGGIIYDPDGYMAMTIMQSGRQKYAGAEPTPAEAKAALASYTAYFGTFTVNERDGVVTHHVQGSLNPNDTGSDQKRLFQFSGDRLILKAPRGPTGVQLRLTWERLPDLPKPTPTQRRMIGFWKSVASERRSSNGELLSSNPVRTGFLIFTASGHVAAHLMDPHRKKFAAAEPTPEEALEAVKTYGPCAYFGPYALQEVEHLEVLFPICCINPGEVGLKVQRHYEFAGSRLILKPPPQTVSGEKVQGIAIWERVSKGVQ